MCCRCSMTDAPFYGHGKRHRHDRPPPKSDACVIPCCVFLNRHSFLPGANPAQHRVIDPGQRCRSGTVRDPVLRSREERALCSMSARRRSNRPFRRDAAWRQFALVCAKASSRLWTLGTVTTGSVLSATRLVHERSRAGRKLPARPHPRGGPRRGPARRVESRKPIAVKGLRVRRWRTPFHRR